MLSIGSRYALRCSGEDKGVCEIGTMLGRQGGKEEKMGVRGPENVQRAAKEAGDVGKGGAVPQGSVALGISSAWMANHSKACGQMRSPVSFRWFTSHLIGKTPQDWSP